MESRHAYNVGAVRHGECKRPSSPRFCPNLDYPGSHIICPHGLWRPQYNSYRPAALRAATAASSAKVASSSGGMSANFPRASASVWSNTRHLTASSMNFERSPYLETTLGEVTAHHDVGILRYGHVQRVVVSSSHGPRESGPSGRPTGKNSGHIPAFDQYENLQRARKQVWLTEAARNVGTGFGMADVNLHRPRFRPKKEAYASRIPLTPSMHTNNASVLYRR
jgi:hypothetical protein